MFGYLYVMSRKRNLRLFYFFLILVIVFKLYLYLRFSGIFSVRTWKYKSRNLNSYIDIAAVPYVLPNNFCANQTLLSIIVISKVNNIETRKIIRETWGKKSDDVSLHFLLGEAHEEIQHEILNESVTFKDIIIERFVDSYDNLTLKSAYLFKLYSQYCADTSKYLLKIDDDVFLNTQKLIDLLRTENAQENLLQGNVMDVEPNRDIFGKWYMPYSFYAESKYPKFLSGPIYWMSNDVPRKFLSCGLKTPIIHLEDVYFTGICASKLNITRRHVTSLRLFDQLQTVAHFCDHKDNIGFHSYNFYNIKQMYRLQTNNCNRL